MSFIWRDDLTEAQLVVMRQAGAILAAIGLLDIASCIVTVSKGGSYSSSLNIFALVAGVLVYRGSARAARFVVSGLSFLLGGLLLLPALGLAITPWRLILLELKLSPWSFLVNAVVFTALLGVLFWVRQLLANLAIHKRGERARPLHRSPAACIGACIPIALAAVLPLFLRGPSAQRAVAEAQRQVGSGYAFHVEQLTTAGASGRAVVVAYSDSEVRRVEVLWSDQP